MGELGLWVFGNQIAYWIILKIMALTDTLTTITLVEKNSEVSLPELLPFNSLLVPSRPESSI